MQCYGVCSALLCCLLLHGSVIVPRCVAGFDCVVIGCDAMWCVLCCGMLSLL